MIDVSRYHGASRCCGWYRCYAATAAFVTLLSQADCSASEERPRHTRGFASASVAESQQTPPGAVVVAAGGYAVCAIRSGRAYCWGKVREDNGRTPAKTRPEPFGGAIVWRTIALAVRRGCGASVDGRTYCWGANDQGQLGREPDTLDHEAPVAVLRLPPLLALAISQTHSCGLSEQGVMFCWGANRNGELGRGSRTRWEGPDSVAGGLRFRALALRDNTTCALDPAGQPYCWGFDAAGLLGHPGPVDCQDAHEAHDAPLSLARCGTLPGPVDAGVRFGTLALGELGGGQACGEAEMGPPYCWGDTLIRISFDTVAAAHAPPRPVPGSPPLVRITGGRQHWCGLTRDQRAHCWGANLYGQLGSGDTTRWSPQPRPVVGGLTFRMLSAGEEHTCGVTTDDRVYCWGRNYEGQLGTASVPHSGTPLEVVLPTE